MKKLLLAILLILHITLCSCNTNTTNELLPYGLAFGDTYEQCVEKITEIDGVIIYEIEKNSGKSDRLYGQETFSSIVDITDDSSKTKLKEEYFGIKDEISIDGYFHLLFNKNKELISFSFTFTSTNVEDSKFENVTGKITNKFERILNEENDPFQDELFNYWGYWLTDEYHVVLWSDPELDENRFSLSIETRETYDIQIENYN